MKTRLVKWDEEYRKKGLVIIDIDHGRKDTLEQVKAAVTKDGVKYATAWDKDAKMCDLYGVQKFAAAMLIGTDGKVVWEGCPTPGKLPKDEWLKAFEAKEALIKKELEKVTPKELEKIAKELEANK